MRALACWRSRSSGRWCHTWLSIHHCSPGPFSSVSLRDLKVQPHGGDPVFTAGEVRARYSLWSILGGKIVVTEAVVESPVISVIQNADGTSNLDAFLKTPAKAEKPAFTARATSSPSTSAGVYAREMPAASAERRRRASSIRSTSSSVDR